LHNLNIVFIAVVIVDLLGRMDFVAEAAINTEAAATFRPIPTTRNILRIFTVAFLADVNR
jgi:hypothetical protein